MKKHSETNERVKRDYFQYLKEAQRHGEQSVDAAAMAIARFEEHTRYRDFKAFHREQAVAFKRHLADQTSQRTKDKLSKSTVRSTLNSLRAFFIWLAGQPGYKSHLSYPDADYFNPSDRDTRIALGRRPREIPTLAQIEHALACMPSATPIERRDRALIAFTLLTGCRDRATVSLKMKHVNIEQRFVLQDAREVETKFGKTISTYFFPVSDEALKVVAAWIIELRADLLWGADDPVFPATLIAPGEDALFRASGLVRRHWRNADPVRRIFKMAFERAGLQYFNPHSFRHALARIGQERCRSPEEMKAWSQNLGHEQVMTTFASYGRIETHRQGEIIKSLGQEPIGDDRLRDLFNTLVSKARQR